MNKHYALLIICAALSHSSSSLAMQKLSDAELQLLTCAITEQKRRIAMEEQILAGKIAKLNAHQEYIQWQERQHLSQKELLAVHLEELQKKVNHTEESLTQSDRSTVRIRKTYYELLEELEEARKHLQEYETNA